MADLSGLPGLREVADAHGLRARRSLGQNFLFDENALERIARCAGDLQGASVVEVGPGPGGLTRAILRSGAGRLVAIEKDRRCLAALAELAAAAQGRLELVEADALKQDLAGVLGKGTVVMGNLPFNISAVLLMRLIEHRERIDRMVLMFQKEVAARLAARPGTRSYGRLGVLVQWLCTVEPCFDLAPRSFVPPPKVSATVLRITPRPEPVHPAPEPALRAVTAAAFGQRRKTLRNSLGQVAENPEALLETAGIAPSSRPEDLDIAAFCALAREHARTA